ncbi:hypothetical protein HMPREF9621_01368 [Cutibacterium modestum HL037PA2]|nr:hypothetical protein HMPREF9621_01368 [Cutibacterium modestum HL037PA2]
MPHSVTLPDAPHPTTTCAPTPIDEKSRLPGGQITPVLGPTPNWGFLKTTTGHSQATATN